MKTIEENNRMIAEFMGMQLTSIGWFDNESNLCLPNTMDNTFDELLFHTSWDWLMPVIDKIESTRHETALTGHYVIILGVTCEIKPSAGFSKNAFRETIFGDTKIDAAYKAVCQFIEWYNENKQS